MTCGVGLTPRPLFYALAGRGFTPTKTEENVPPHPIPELPEGQNPHYILLLWHNTGRTFLPFDFARQDVRFWAGERGNALTPHDRGGRHKAL